MTEDKNVGNFYTDPQRGEVLEELSALLASAPYLRSFSRRLLDMGVSIADKTLRHISQKRLVHLDNRDNRRSWILSRERAEEVLEAVKVLVEEDRAAGLKTHFEYAEPDMIPYDAQRERVLRELSDLVIQLYTYTSLVSMGQHIVDSTNTNQCFNGISKLVLLNQGKIFNRVSVRTPRQTYLMSQSLAESWLAALRTMPSEKHLTYRRKGSMRKPTEAKLRVLDFIADQLKPYFETGRGRMLHRRADEFGNNPSVSIWLAVHHRLYRNEIRAKVPSDQTIAALLSAVVKAKRSEVDRPIPNPIRRSGSAQARAGWEKRRLNQAAD